jgi:hypothetical protein
MLIPVSINVVRGDILVAVAFVIFGYGGAHRELMKFAGPGGKAGLILFFCLSNDDCIGIE